MTTTDQPTRCETTVIDVRRIYRQGIDSGIATFETQVPPTTRLAAK